MNVKLIATLLVVAFALFMVVTQPASSADAVRAAFNGVTSVFESVATFVRNL